MPGAHSAPFFGLRTVRASGGVVRARPMFWKDVNFQGVAMRGEASLPLHWHEPRAGEIAGFGAFQRPQRLGGQGVTNRMNPEFYQDGAAEALPQLM